MKFLRRPLLMFSALLALAAVFLPQITFAQPAARAERPAQQRTDEGQSNGQNAGQGVLRLLPADAVSDKEITVGDRKIAYTATAGTLPLFDQNGERTASVYYI
jgi:carboxypeptidase C (cathepsin A)